MAKRGQKLRQRSSKKKTHRGKRVTHKIRTRKHAKKRSIRKRSTRKRSTRKRRHTFPRLTRTKKQFMKGGMFSNPIDLGMALGRGVRELYKKASDMIPCSVSTSYQGTADGHPIPIPIPI